MAGVESKGGGRALRMPCGRSPSDDGRRLFYLYLYFIPFSSSIHAICLEEPATLPLLSLALYRSPRISSDIMFPSAVLQQSPIQYAMVTHITAGTCMYYMYVCMLYVL